MSILRQLLSPKLDLIFKLLFIKDKEMLINLINASLKRTGKTRIQTIEIVNPTLLPEEMKKKFIILDIHAHDQSGNRYDIEMQVNKYVSYSKRALFYLCKMYTEQLDSGEEYGTLKPTIGIHFLDYRLYPDKDEYSFCFEFRSDLYPELTLNDDMSLHIFELPKIVLKENGEDRQSNKENEDLVEWLHFFNKASEEVDETMRTHYNNPMIHKAFNYLETLSASEEIRLQAELREKQLKDEASMLGDARREGEKIGFDKGEKIGFDKGEKSGYDKGADKTKLEIAYALKQKDVDIKMIAGTTGLSIEAIMKL